MSRSHRSHLKQRSDERYSISTNRKLVRAIGLTMAECKLRKNNPLGVTKLAQYVYELKDYTPKPQYLVNVIDPRDYKRYWFIIGYHDNKLFTFLPLNIAFQFAVYLPDQVNQEVWQQFKKMENERA